MYIIVKNNCVLSYNDSALECVADVFELSVIRESDTIRAYINSKMYTVSYPLEYTDSEALEELTKRVAQNLPIGYRIYKSI